MDMNKILEYSNSKKSIGAAYVIWFFLGIFGGHRFYLNSSLARYQCFLIFTSIASLEMSKSFQEEQFMYGVCAFIWFIGIIFAIFWVLIDLFLIPSLASKCNIQIMSEMGLNDPKIIKI